MIEFLLIALSVAAAIFYDVTTAIYLTLLAASLSATKIHTRLRQLVEGEDYDEDSEPEWGLVILGLVFAGIIVLGFLVT